MLYRYAKFMKHDTAAAGDLSAFTDAGDASGWAVEALRWAYAEGLITGRTATTIVPQGTATRAEVAMILMRFWRGTGKVTASSLKHTSLSRISGIHSIPSCGSRKSDPEETASLTQRTSPAKVGS